MRPKILCSLNLIYKLVRNLVSLIALSVLLFAAVGGGLSGAVTDSVGRAVSHARVVAVSAAQGIQTKATTDAKGAYRFPALTVGQYDVKVDAPGFKPSTRRITVHVDDKVRLDFVLETERPSAETAP